MQKEGERIMQELFEFHSDPGHGWLKVPLKLLVELNITDKISTYSYLYNNKQAFLEEDCDASIFIEAWKKAGNKIQFDIINTNHESTIRLYPMYYYKKGENET